MIRCPSCGKRGAMLYSYLTDPPVDVYTCLTCKNEWSYTMSEEKEELGFVRLPKEVQQIADALDKLLNQGKEIQINIKIVDASNNSN